ncbi:MAG: alpha/beta fold hydrolase [Pseudomonadota bacterium]
MSTTATSAAAELDTDGVLAQAQAFFSDLAGRGARRLELATAAPEPVGLTPKDVVLERGTLRLYHYRPLVDEVYRVPVLLVMATTNKSFVFDLAPGQSMIEFLLQRGFDVYTLDWAPPTQAERHLSLEDYTQDFIPSCAQAIQTRSGEPELSIIGYCMGGVLSLIYAATHRKGPLKNLACITTPVDWHQLGLMNVWNDPEYFDVDQLVDTLGILPVEAVTRMFEMQRPAQKTAGEMRLWSQLADPDFVRSFRAFERWGEETLPLAGEYVRETTKALCWDNQLYTGELQVSGRSADLAQIEVPVLSIVAQHDHLAPRKATEPLLRLVGSEDKQEVLLKGGHVSLIAGLNARRRMWPQLERWLAVRST